MRNAIKGWVAAAVLVVGATLGLGAGEARAAPIDTSGYASSEILLNVQGYVIGDVDDFGIFFEASGPFPLVALPEITVTTGTFGTPTSVSLAADTDGDFVDDVNVSTAAEVSIMAQMIQFLFEDGAIGYLVTIDSTGNTNLVTGLPVDFENELLADTNSPFEEIDVDATITLEKLSTPVIPLPAGLPLLLGALATMVFLRRHASAG